MMPSPLIIFDDGLGRLGPMVDLRAAFEVRSGVFTTAGRIAARLPGRLAGYWVPQKLRAVVAERANAAVNELPDEAVLCCVNGRWILPSADLKLAPGEAAVEDSSGTVVAAVLSRADAESFLATNELPDGVRSRGIGEGLLYRFPWDILSHLPRTIPQDIRSSRILDAKVPGGDTVVVGQHPVGVHESATLYPQVVLDAEQGPIAIHERAVIRPGAIICGPCSIGRDSTVIDRALIKPHTVIGPVCKVGGEVGGTIFQGYSNKAHDGHLGDSWVGKWVNFGAGATNSNLLNTYGEVTMRLEPEGPMYKTGRAFVGAIVGDHVKLAIETRLTTGAVLGTGAMIAMTGFPPAVVRRFAWLTDRGEQVYRFEKFLETARKMMARRDKEPGEAYVEAMRALHEKATKRPAAGG